jgi:4-amino-4-deoxy-L-arabinose transferase-like glycosyltransferase
MKRGPGLPTKRSEAAWVLAALLLFLALAWHRALSHPFPFYDDVAYLATAHEIHELGGPIALAAKLYGGTFSEANRHPLYLAVLSLVAGDVGLAYHVRAQILTAALGALALLTLWWVVRRHFGPRTALVAIALFAVSDTLVENSARETCEPLLIALWALATSAILDGEKRPAWFVAAGALSGLAFLTKGTGISLPICFFFAMLAAHHARVFARWSFWGFYAAFTLTSSPLLVRNARMYGTPLYNLNSRWLWIDRLPDFAEVVAPRAEQLLPHGPVEYFRQATIGSIAERVASGIFETIFHFGDAMSFVAPYPYGAIHIALVVVGIGATFLAVYLLWKRPRSWLRTFLLVEAAWFYAFFAFYDAVSASSRYLIPMTMMLVAILSEAIAAFEPRRATIPIRITAFGAAAAAVVAMAWPRAAIPPGFAETESWLTAHLAPGEAFAIDSRTMLQPAWLVPQSRQVIVSASFQSKPVPAEALIAHFRANGVRWVLLDASSRCSGALSDDPSNNRYFFYDRVPLDKDGLLPLAGYPSDLRLAYADPSSPRRWIVLELETEGPAGDQAAGSHVELTPSTAR